MDIFKNIENNPLGQHSDTKEDYFFFPKLEGEIGPRMKFEGKEVLTWSLNNYLGLANHPEVRKVDADAAKEWGLAYPMGARMMSGNSVHHKEFESQLADFVNKKSVMLLNYGYQGVFSIIDALVDRRDVVIYDAESHASIVDGVRLHIGKRFVYPHNNIEGLEKQLIRASKIVDETGGGILIITEGVFGMSGTTGDLKSIVDLKKTYEFRLMLDDAHGFGTMGPTGAGVGEDQGVQDQVDLYFSTFAKSMASIGAFIAGDEDVINYLRYTTRSQIFAKSLPMPFVIGGMKRLELIRNHPEYRSQLWSISRTLQDGLRSAGFNLGTTKSPVTPVMFSGGIYVGANIAIDIRENYNIFCSIVVYPVVPKDVIMLRLIPTAVHTLDDVYETIDVFSKVKNKLDHGTYMRADVENVFK